MVPGKLFPKGHAKSINIIYKTICCVQIKKSMFQLTGKWTFTSTEEYENITEKE